MDNAMWTEKYRPSNFNEVKGHKEIVSRIRAFVEQKNLPHVLFSGPAGVGKTSLSLVVAKELYGENWKENFLELNASVTGDTPILIRKNGKIKRTDFNDLNKKYFDEGDAESRKAIDDLEILSIGKQDLRVKFSKINYLFRHKVNKIAKITYEGGKIQTSLNHSIIVFDKMGNLVEKKCEDLKKGDLLITFKSTLEGQPVKLDLRDYKPQSHIQLRSGLLKNPRVNHDFDELPLNNDMGWALGLYTAEGCTSLKENRTSGQLIFTVSEHEQNLVDRTKATFSNLNISTYQTKGKSGFDRTKLSSIQLKVLSTQLAKFVRNNFYNSEIRRAPAKRFLSQIFDACAEQRIEFLKGYFEGDGSGDWGSVARLSSTSKDCLIDAVWLSKISGIEASYFPLETRLIWENSKFAYVKSQLLPAEIFIEAIKHKKADYDNVRYILRHQLYSKRSGRIKKAIAQKILDNITDSDLKNRLQNLVKSDIFVLKVTDVSFEDYDDYVYDVSVPESQMFFGGINPILLHNSDERGIDVVRVKVKDFARTRSLSSVPFKIIYLDESDALTREAQQALRRTMERYSKTARFILSCVTPDTRILLPGEREIAIKDFVEQYESDKPCIRVENLSPGHSIKSDVVVAAVKLPASSIGKKVLEITTTSGRKIKVTDDHQLFTTQGWKEAGKLSKDDKLLVYPHLETTPVEDDPRKIIDLNNFIQFLSQTEKQDGYKMIGEAAEFCELDSQSKEQILKKIKELRQIKDGLTPREFEMYSQVKNSPGISRESLQIALSITRMGANYLITSLVKKGYIQRMKTKKMHSFFVTDKKAIVLRNDADIRKIVQEEFKLKISYSAVKKSAQDVARGRIDRVLGELVRKELLNVTYNDIEKVGPLARVCGFMLGDGHLVRNDIRLHFKGNEQALLLVQKDLELLGYTNYSKITAKTLTNTIMGRTFKGTTTSFSLDSRPLSLLVQYLGIPKGDKVIVSYQVPEFVLNGTKFVKREFLRALFGCDADKPAWKIKNCGAVSLRQNKAKSLQKDMYQYYNELSQLFSAFDVDTYVSSQDRGEVRTRDNVPVFTAQLVIRSNYLNSFRYFSRIGYAYEAYKIRLSRLSAEYLRYKEYVKSVLREKAELVVELVHGGSSIVDSARTYDVSSDFVSNRVNGKPIISPRYDFMTFNAWVKKHETTSELLMNEIAGIKEVHEDIVMDITCQTNHNFITNGLVSHNCNYSSKIIDPIQSRCAVFHFKPLQKDDMFAIIDIVAQNEGLDISVEAKDALIQISGGDCRRVENILQSAAVVEKKITVDSIYATASTARPKDVIAALELAVQGKFTPARDKLLQTMLDYGLSGLDLIKQIQHEVWNLKVSDRQKVELIEKCGEIEFRMTEGSDEFVQLEALLASFVKIAS